MASVEMIAVRNVNTPGRTTNVNVEKYQAMRKVLLKVLPKKQPGLTWAEMLRAVQPHLPQDLWPKGAKAGWWAKTVQLDLEARRLVRRAADAKPFRWYRV
jgi:hypothetical protein